MRNIPKDIYFIIRDFLVNKDITEFLCLSRNFVKLFNSKNIYTSLSIYPNHGVFDYIHHYVQHEKSLKKVYMYNIIDPHIWWTFPIDELHLIRCKVTESNIESKINNVKKLIISS